MGLTSAARRFWQALPDNRIKQNVRSVLRSIIPSRYDPSFVAELASLDIKDAGTTDDGVPFIKLGDETALFGTGPLRNKSNNWYQNDLAAYGRLPLGLRQKIPPGCIRLALDVVLRYKYPHATPDITPPYPFETRRLCWFGQHSDTIDDLAGLSEPERAQLKERFRVRPGDVVVDAGACYGFGALRYSRMVGPSGRVLAVEADPAVQQLFVRNMTANDVNNVDLVRCGVWKEPGEFSLFVGSVHRQDNSLRSGVYPSEQTVTVPTRTIDSIVETSGVQKVSLVSISVNTAEVEAVLGMDEILKRFKPNLSIAGWLKREDNVLVHEVLSRVLSEYPGYRVEVGPTGRVLAWNSSG